MTVSFVDECTENGHVHRRYSRVGWGGVPTSAVVHHLPASTVVAAVGDPKVVLRAEASRS